MKKMTALAFVGGMTLSLVSPAVFADQVEGQTKTTPAQVEITDNTDPVDPIDPTDPDQEHLTLESVPANYNFETALKSNNYTISADTTGENIEVFNDRSDREWSVKATVSSDQLSLAADNETTFDVNSFKVNNTELVGTGASGIVAKSTAADETNTGLIKTPVDTISIGFTDTNKVLKVGDKLNGTVEYSLYNTADAQ